jgi:hypothetical protein
VESHTTYLLQMPFSIGPNKFNIAPWGNQD